MQRWSDASATQRAAAHPPRRLRRQPKRGWMSLSALREHESAPEFALEILQELGHIESQGATWRITARGVLAYETACQD